MRTRVVCTYVTVKNPTVIKRRCGSSRHCLQPGLLAAENLQLFRSQACSANHHMVLDKFADEECFAHEFFQWLADGRKYFLHDGLRSDVMGNFEAERATHSIFHSHLSKSFFYELRISDCTQQASHSDVKLPTRCPEQIARSTSDRAWLSHLAWPSS